MRATFDNPNGVLFPNQFVNVRLLVDTMSGVTLAPNAAISSAHRAISSISSTTIHGRQARVAIGPTDGKQTVITSGLAAGDKVVIDGVDRLRDGAKVKVVDQAAAGAARPGARRGGSAAGSTNGDGQRHGRRHDQAGATDNSAPPAAATPAPARRRGHGASTAASAPPGPGRRTKQGSAQ